VILVLGLAVAGAATVRALRQRGYEVVAADDTVDDAKRQVAAELGVELVASPDLRRLAELVTACDVVVPAPGVPETHRVFAIAHGLGRPVVSELELAYGWEQQRPGGPRPMLAVTGTDGKTTTTLWAVEMLAAGGVRSVAAGNTDVPLVEALDLDVDAFVVECTSFRLAWTRAFRGDAAAWLNLAPDHLNWHVSMETYTAAKAHIFTQQRPDDVAIGFAADPIVMAQLAMAPARHVTFGTPDSDYRVAGSGGDRLLVGPQGELGAVASLGRALPHDLTNGLAAAALVLETGLVGPEAVAAGLASFVGPPHRIELVGDAAGVRWYNDSKATTPHAASVAIRAFDHVVLIAGGLNKGLDLAPMAAHPERLRTVVAIGQAADVIAETFAGAAPVVRADSMAEAVERAAGAARSGDVVLLSPGCASFDWYPDGGYPARGDDFRRLVQQRLGRPPTPSAHATTGAA
jgi:UDP-N-acetylmuramoylalanine--D-glutamate ligase